MMRKSITSKFDIEKLVDVFFEKLKKDKLLSPYFSAIPDQPGFLKTFRSFWENVIFFSGTYNGNPMGVHQHLHTQMPLQQQHFKRWEGIFNETVDEMFEGEKVDFIKQRAKAISVVMQVKILKSGDGISD